MKDFERSSNGRRPMIRRPSARPATRRSPSLPRTRQPRPAQRVPVPVRRMPGSFPKPPSQARRRPLIGRLNRPLPSTRPGFTPSQRPTPPRGVPPRRPPYWHRRRRPPGGWGPRVTTWHQVWDDPTPADDGYPTDSQYTGNIALPVPLREIGTAGRRALWRSGLLEPGWVRRLSQAPEALIQFIRQSWQIAGFEYAVRAFFGSRLQKQAAIMAVRLTRLAAERNTGARAQMVFTQEIEYAPGAGAFLSLQMELNGHHFILLPWAELDERTVGRQFARHQKLFGNDSFRWVLSSSALGMQKDEVMNRLKDLLAQNASGPVETNTSDPAETNTSDQEGNEPERLQKMVIVLP